MMLFDRRLDLTELSDAKPLRHELKFGVNGRRYLTPEEREAADREYAASEREDRSGGKLARDLIEKYHEAKEVSVDHGWEYFSPVRSLITPSAHFTDFLAGELKGKWHRLPKGLTRPEGLRLQADFREEAIGKLCINYGQYKDHPNPKKYAGDHDHDILKVSALTGYDFVYAAAQDNPFNPYGMHGTYPASDAFRGFVDVSEVPGAFEAIELDAEMLVTHMLSQAMLDPKSF